MDNVKKTAGEIVHQHMLAKDAFSQWLGIQIKEVKEGYCCLEMKVRPDMINGFQVAHGGITYSLADSALAFASNSFGIQAVSIETSISHLQKVYDGNILQAETQLKKKGNTISVFDVTITNENKTLVALFKGTVYHTGKNW